MQIFVQKYIFICWTADRMLTKPRKRSMSGLNVLPWTDRAFIHLMMAHSRFRSIRLITASIPKQFLKMFLLYYYWLLCYIRCENVNDFQSVLPPELPTMCTSITLIFLEKKYQMDAHPGVALNRTSNSNSSCAAPHSIGINASWRRPQGLARLGYHFLNCLFTEFTPSTIQLHLLSNL